MPRFDLYLSFTGGPTLDRLRERYGAPRPRAFYCPVDPESTSRARAEPGTWVTWAPTARTASRRSHALLAARPAPTPRRFAVAGPRYP